MRLPVSLLLILSLFTGALFAGVPHPSLPSATIPQGLGMNIHFTNARAGELEMMAAAGCKWVRMDFGWGGTERERGVYDFSAYDELTGALKANGMHAVFILDYGNKLYGHERSVVSDEGRQAFAAWAAAALTHFKGQGILWEIWNEPNGGFWHPKANVKEYAAMALAACKAMRAAAPGEAIIGPATSEVDLPFLEGCFQAGLLEFWDAVSVHPYRQQGPETVALDYAKLRRLIARHAPKGKVIPILSGEWGYSSAWHHYDVEKQGKMLPRQWLTNLSLNVPLSIWYDWHEDGTDPKEAEHHFGSVGHEYHAGSDTVYEPKPAYLAAKTLTATLNGFQFVKRLATGSADDYVLLFAKGDVPCVAAWTTAEGSHPVKAAAAAGEFAVTAHTGMRLPSIEARSGFLDITLNDAPQYLMGSTANTQLTNGAAMQPVRATLIPTRGRSLGIRVENLSDARFEGRVKLTQVKGMSPQALELPLVMEPDTMETNLTVELTSPPAGEYALGLTIENHHGVMLEAPVQRFRAVPDSLLENCHVVADGDPKVKSEQSFELSPAPEPPPDREAKTARITYRFDAGWRFVQMGPKNGADRKIEGEPRAFGCWIYGDGNHQAPRMRVVDATGQTWQPGEDTIHWKGWRYVEFKLHASTIHWGGANDGVIHYPLRWDVMLIVDNVSRRATSGVLFSTAPVLIY